MNDTRWCNVYPGSVGGRWFAPMCHTRAEADRIAGPERLYVLRFDLDDEGDRDIVTREAV